jgi:predicted nucleotidyltransferase component of viral defense system
MLTTNELRRIAARSGARQIAYVEIDVILTHLLQLFHERALFEHLVFKGGTMLRKMIFGKRGRLSTDLDFTLGSSIRRDDLMLKLLDVSGNLISV